MHANIGLSLAVDIPIDGHPGVASSPSPKLQAGSEGTLAEFVALVGQDDLYIILPAILADNKDGTLTSIKTMGMNEMGDDLLKNVDVGRLQKVFLPWSAVYRKLITDPNRTCVDLSDRNSFVIDQYHNIFRAGKISL